MVGGLLYAANTSNVGSSAAATTTLGYIDSFTCGVSTVSDADGNIYNTVKIGSQCWMKQNLRVGTMITGATTQTNNGTIEKWCYENTLANCMTTNNPNYPDGGLYQWDEAMQYSTTAGAQGICPAGWHIPTHDEFTTLERAVCTSGTCATDFPYDTTTTGYRGTTEGTKLKPSGTSGFELNLAGYGGSGSFYYRSSFGFVWSSSESGANAWYRYVFSGGAPVGRYADTKSFGLSVRCLKDDPRDTGKVIISSTVIPPAITNLSSGLVGYWTFDGRDVNWGTGIVTDKSGTGNHGTMVGLSTTTSPTIGKQGQAFRFDGVDDYLVIGDGGTVQTISFWLKTNDATNQKVIALNGTAQMELDGAGLITATSWSSPTYYLDGVVDSRVVSSGWHHVAITTNTGISASNIEIGRVSTSYFNGTIDDVRIYNRVLSAAEVAELYQWGSDVLVDAAPYTPPAPPTPPFNCGVETITDADGNVYDTVEIGSQCWMKQNMRVGTMITGATTQTNNSTIEKWCYSNTLANCMTTNNPNHPDGGLYQWDEAMQYSTTPGAQGICPAGWHIPTDTEYKTLEMYLGMSQVQADATGWRGTTEGTKLKPNGTSGFEGNLAGYGYSGSFDDRSTGGGLWSSSGSGANAWGRYLYSSEARVYRYSYGKSSGLSVRCLQDS